MFAYLMYASMSLNEIFILMPYLEQSKILIFHKKKEKRILEITKKAIKANEKYV